MTLLAILLCLAAERLLPGYQEYRDADWLPDYFRAMQGLPVPAALRHGAGALAWLLLPPLLLVGLVQGVLGSALVGIPGLVFAALVLYFSLGPQELTAQASALASALERGDERDAFDLSWDLLGHEPPRDPTAFTRRAVAGILEQANRRAFAVLFWFALLGPLGAVGYRLTHLLREQAGAALSDPRLSAECARLIGILDWIPARITAAGYALAGNFEQAVRSWRQCAAEFPADSRETLICAGSGALAGGDGEAAYAAAEGDAAPAIRAATALVRRTLLLWVVVLALLSLLG